MAGPNVSIIYEHELSDQEIEDVYSSLGGEPLETGKIDFSNLRSTLALGGTIDGYLGGIVGGVGTVKNQHVEMYDDEIQELQTAWGIEARSVIALACMSNGDTDHRVLGELALYFAKKFGGIIDFNGLITPPWDDVVPWYRGSNWFFYKANWSDIRKKTMRYLEQIPGKITAIEYEVNEQRRWAYHVCDVEFMENWLKHPHFHMIK